MHKANGFTLIEILIVVVIVSIISAFAYPSYVESLSKTRRSECQGEMLALANALERFNSANSGYTGATAALYSTTCPVDNNQKYYNFSVNVTSGAAYIITAAPIGAHLEDKCGSLTLTQTGARGAIGNTLPLSSCWE